MSTLEKGMNMAHRFTITETINGLSFEDFKKIVADPKFHEGVSEHIPGTNKVILESQVVGSTYTLDREYNLDINIPDIAKKLLKDAFRIKRKDQFNLEAYTSTVDLGSNSIPLQAHCDRKIVGTDNQLTFTMNWEVKVKVPLLGGLLEKHAEGEVRKFTALELSIIEQQAKAYLAQ